MHRLYYIRHWLRWGPRNSRGNSHWNQGTSRKVRVYNSRPSRQSTIIWHRSSMLAFELTQDTENFFWLLKLQKGTCFRTTKQTNNWHPKDDLWQQQRSNSYWPPIIENLHFFNTAEYGSYYESFHNNAVTSSLMEDCNPVLPPANSS